MERNNYLEEVIVLKIIYNWYKVVDGRGFNEVLRFDYCKDMLKWILEVWIFYFKIE